MWMTKVKTTVVAVLAVAALGLGTGAIVVRAVAEDAPKENASKPDKDKLQGAWILVSHEVGGQKLEPDDDHKGKVVVDGDTMTLMMGNKSMTVTFKLDESKKVKAIDMTETNNGVAETHLGIYQLDGDTLTICKSHPPMDRPAAFASKEGEKWPAVFVFKRQKAK